MKLRFWRRERPPLTTVVDQYGPGDVLGYPFEFPASTMTTMIGCLRDAPGGTSVDVKAAVRGGRWVDIELIEGDTSRVPPTEPWVGSVGGKPCRFVYDETSNCVRNLDPITFDGHELPVDGTIPVDWRWDD